MTSKPTLLITGGAGFIGTNLVRMMAREGRYRLVVVDALTYAGNLGNLSDVIDADSVHFRHLSINDSKGLHGVFEEFAPDAVIHLAAESHVDRSISDAAPFVTTNVAGTLVLMDVARHHKVDRFLHVSTDEVYGSLEQHEAPFTEQSPIQPTSPYAASKASSDLLVAAYVKTHGFPAVITRCSNNYGPYQFPEKLIPLMTLNALEGRPLPVYGDGLQVRDWIHVDDHCRGLIAALQHGAVGEIYNLGGSTELPNRAVVDRIITSAGASPSLITYVEDRKAHDRRYAIDSAKAQAELDWKPIIAFEEGLQQTVSWYKDNAEWCANVRNGAYRDYYAKHYRTEIQGIR